MLSAAPSFRELCYLRSGSLATSWSSTFDADLQRFQTDDGFLAYASVPTLRTTVAFFDPVLVDADATDPEAARPLVEAFLQAHPRAAFLHCSPTFATTLADVGLLINPYGVENRVTLPLALGGSRMRGLRREVQAAQANGVTVIPIPSECGAAAAVWDEVRSVDRRWLQGRVMRREVRRATRRSVAGPERYTSKFIARGRDGKAVGWACFDHVFERESVVGVALSVVRSDPHYPGVSTLLAAEGSSMCAKALPSVRFLDLGLSPLAPVPEGVEWNPLVVCRADEECEVDPERAQFIDVLFASLFRWGTGLYNTAGLASWKRKWRPDEGLSYVAVQNRLPVRELAAALALLVV
jgi:lysylphosphatidylglycerol synthetase-like protein (DUF2156 family)